MVKRGIWRCLPAFAALVGMLASCGDSKPAETEAEIYCTQLKAVNKLQLGEMTVTKMATIDDLQLSDARSPRQAADALIDALKIGTRKAAYSYDTYLRAYIDLHELQPSDIVIDESTHHATLRLPPVTVEFAGRDPQIREEHYRVTGMRSQVSAAERAALKEAMNTRLKSEVESNPQFRATVAAAAEERCRRYFEEFFAARGYTSTIEFRGQQPSIGNLTTD